MARLGDVVTYQPPAGYTTDKPLAGIIIGVNTNPDSADLHVFNGYTQGETDIPKVLESESGNPEPGRFVVLPVVP